MRIVHFSTFERMGGAARSAHRLHEGLRGAGIDSRMLVRYRETVDKAVAQVSSDRHGSILWSTLERRWIATNRTDVTNTWFSTGRPGSAAAAHPWVDEADVLHLHWVPGLLASRDIRELLAIGKPVIWTLHDEWPFTGGCHFASGCERWRSACAECPQLREDPHRLVEAVFNDKRRDYAQGNLTVVAPSQWLADRARASALLGDRDAERIEYGIDLERYSPADRESRRAELEIGEGELAILFAANDAAERRKGFHVLLEALAAVARAAGAPRLRLVTMGARTGESAALPVACPVTDCGVVRDESAIAATFAACDLFVIPSLEDNQPNTMIESLACGTPVIGSDAGGIPEVLSSQSFDAIAPPGDADALASLLAGMLSRPERLHAARGDARRIAEDRFGIERHAARYAALYERVLCSTKP